MNSVCKKKALTHSLEEVNVSEVEVEAQKLAEFLYSLYVKQKKNKGTEAPGSNSPSVADGE